MRHSIVFSLSPLTQRILRVALPAIVSNITVPLLGLVDVAITGHLGSAAYIGAIAVGTMIFNVLYWPFGFLRMGTSGLTGQMLGARRLDEVARLLIRSLLIAAALALLFILLQQPILHAAWLFMHPTPEVRPLAATYFHICIWGAPAVFGLYSLNGWCIGQQNSRIPMTVAIVQNVINITLSLLLVRVCGMKVEGVALGTLVAQYAGLLLSATLCLHRYGRLRRYFSWEGMFERTTMRRIFVVNSDIFLRSLFLAGVNLFITAAGSWQGNDILAVNTLLMQFFFVYSYFIDGFAYAGEALCAKALGARRHTQFRRTIRHIFLWGTAVSLLFILLFAFSGTTFVRWLTDQPSVIHLSARYLPWIVAVPVAGMAAFLWDGIFVGTTATRQLFISTFAAAIVFFATYYGLPHLFAADTNHILWLAFILYLITRGVTQTILNPTIWKVN